MSLHQYGPRTDPHPAQNVQLRTLAVQFQDVALRQVGRLDHVRLRGISPYGDRPGHDGMVDGDPAGDAVQICGASCQHHVLGRALVADHRSPVTGLPGCDARGHPHPAADDHDTVTGTHVVPDSANEGGLVRRTVPGAGRLPRRRREPVPDLPRYRHLDVRVAVPPGARKQGPDPAAVHERRHPPDQAEQTLVPKNGSEFVQHAGRSAVSGSHHNPTVAARSRISADGPMPRPPA